jgi:hypothetical protein
MIVMMVIRLQRNIYRYRRKTGSFPDLTKRPMDVYLVSIYNAIIAPVTR